MCQFEIGSTVNTYNPTTTAAFQGPRFDHDPVSLACKGLLIEESRTNLILQSEDFGTTWAAVNATVSTNVATAPNGIVAADKLIINSGSTAGRFSQLLTLTGFYVMSVFAKAGEWGWVFVTPLSNAGGVWFNLSNGTIGTQNSGYSGFITSFGNGWYRCSVVSLGTTVAQTARVTPTNADGLYTAGDGTSGILAWGAQLEAGLFPTSYIPTTTASVIRSADVCSISGSAFSGFYNPLEGSFATSIIFNAPVSSTIGQVVFDVNDTTTLNRTRLLRNSTTGTAGYSNTVGGTQNVAIIGSTSITANQIAKFSCCMKTNDFAVYLNNASQGTDVICTMQAAPTTLTIGDVSAGAARAPMNGTIDSLRYYKKRLSDSKLQILTV